MWIEGGEHLAKPPYGDVSKQRMEAAQLAVATAHAESDRLRKRIAELEQQLATIGGEAERLNAELNVACEWLCDDWKRRYDCATVDPQVFRELVRVESAMRAADAAKGNIRC